MQLSCAETVFGPVAPLQRVERHEEQTPGGEPGDAGVIPDLCYLSRGAT